MASTRRLLLTGLLGSLGLSIPGISMPGVSMLRSRVETRPLSTGGHIVTYDGWVLRQSDLDLVR